MMATWESPSTINYTDMTRISAILIPMQLYSLNLSNAPLNSIISFFSHPGVASIKLKKKQKFHEW